jgi:hypothetical protein
VGGVPFHRFEESWAKTGHLTLVAAPGDRIVVAR